jgi:unsaturated chondroitin disaccharide hydrolase
MNTNVQPITASAVDTALDNACKILHCNLSDFTDKFQDSNSQNNFYLQTDNVEWTTGFCTGEYWLAYEHTGDEAFSTAALSQVDSFLNRIEKKIDVNHHDMGFLYTPSCVAAYKLTGNETAKKAALLAANNLIERFQAKGQFLQAWGELGAPDNYRLIIDCLLNLPLLYWAAEITGNNTYAEIARAHTKTSLANLVRDDNSTYHTYFFNPETGVPQRGATQQGYRDGSAWARGQAWGVYGLALSYRYTKTPECLELFDRVTGFFIDRLPEDLVSYWDLDFKDGDGEPKDSSAAAIAACGMLEMAKYLSDEKAEYYTDIAKRITASLVSRYAVSDIHLSNALLLHGVYAKNSPYNPIPKDRGVDEANTWGDYFYMELLTRLSKDWKIYW